MLEPQCHGRLQVAQLGTAIVARPAEAVGEHLFFQHQRGDAVGQLDLAAGPGLDFFQVVEDPRRQDVAPHHAQRGRRIFRFGFFDDAVHQLKIVRKRHAADDAVLAGLLARHILHTEDRALVLFEHLDHLRDDRRFAVDQVVRQQHRERLVLHHRSGAQHRVAQAQRLDLADIDAVDVRRRDLAHDAQQLVLAAHRQLGLQLVGLVEVVLDRALVAPGDEHHVGDARSHCLFHRILDQRLVDDGHHLLGTDLGRRQESAAHACDRKYCFCYLFHYKSP